MGRRPEEITSEATTFSELFLSLSLSLPLPFFPLFLFFVLYSSFFHTSHFKWNFGRVNSRAKTRENNLWCNDHSVFSELSLPSFYFILFFYFFLLLFTLYYSFHTSHFKWNFRGINCGAKTRGNNLWCNNHSVFSWIGVTVVE